MIAFGPEVWDRMVAAVEAVRDRLRRATAALEGAGVPYAVIGGNAVAAWVARVDPAAVRNTQDVDILLRRDDFDRAKVAMEAAGFIYRHAASIDMFLDGKGAKARDAVHILFANEKVRAEYVEPSADVSEVETSEDGRYRHLKLEALVRMKLTSFRLKDQVHLQDMAQLGLIDATWPAKFRPELAERLQQILDNPDM
jgi:Uncharacterised nucleotidyltransferase